MSVKGWTEMNKIRIIKKAVGEKPLVMEIANELGAYNQIVGGYIECVYLQNNIILVVNEEGKLEGLEDNFYMTSLHDMIVGDVFFVSLKDGDFANLNKNQINIILKWFEK